MWLTWRGPVKNSSTRQGASRVKSWAATCERSGWGPCRRWRHPVELSRASPVQRGLLNMAGKSPGCLSQPKKSPFVGDFPQKIFKNWYRFDLVKSNKILGALPRRPWQHRCCRHHPPHRLWCQSPSPWLSAEVSWNLWTPWSAPFCAQIPEWASLVPCASNTLAKWCKGPLFGMLSGIPLATFDFSLNHIAICHCICHRALGANLNVLLIWLFRPQLLCEDPNDSTTAPFASSFLHNYDCESSVIANAIKYGDWAHCKSNMWEENRGSPCSLKYASSASNMPQTTVKSLSLVPMFGKFLKYIGSQSRLAQGMAIPLTKKLIRPTNPNAHHAKHFLRKTNYNSTVFFSSCRTTLDCGVWTGECKARSVECTVEICGMQPQESKAYGVECGVRVGRVEWRVYTKWGIFSVQRWVQWSGNSLHPLHATSPNIAPAT